MTNLPDKCKGCPFIGSLDKDRIDAQKNRNKVIAHIYKFMAEDAANLEMTTEIRKRRREEFIEPTEEYLDGLEQEEADATKLIDTALAMCQDGVKRMGKFFIGCSYAKEAEYPIAMWLRGLNQE